MYCILRTCPCLQVKFHVVFSPGTGHFEIMEGDSLAASGKMVVVDDPNPPDFFYEVR